jgi:putative phosphoesterase
MKLAVLADIHANYHALQAVTDHIENWAPDQVVIAGDIINRGPRPEDCLRFILDKRSSDNWLFLRGNHEEYVISQSDLNILKTSPDFDVHQASTWTFQKLDNDVSILKQMPFHISMNGKEGGEILVIHASMGGIRDGIYPWMSDKELHQKICGSPAVFCVGHTHLPFVHCLDGIVVVNVGSAGLPFDGNYHPSYAQISYKRGRWHADIIRVEYDLSQAEKDFIDSGYLEEAGPLAQLVHVELKVARSQLYQWAVRYQDHVLAGEITIQESVNDYWRIMF